MDNAWIIAAVAAVFILAGLVKGVIGMGLPTVCMGLLGLWLPTPEAAALLVVPSLVTNVWQLLTGSPLRRLLRRLWPLLAGICVGTWGGAGIMDGLSAADARYTLGIALAVYAVFGLARIHFHVRPRAEPWLALPVGALTGMLAGATGVFVIPAVPYLQALEMDRDEMIQALGLSFTVSTLAMAASLATMGAFSVETGLYSALALLPAGVGMIVGQWLRGWISPGMFRSCFFLSLLALGLYMVI